MGVHIKHCLLIPLINYNTDTGLDVVFDLFPGQAPTSITLCVCAPTTGEWRTQMNVQVEVTVNTRPENKSKTGICVVIYW